VSLEAAYSVSVWRNSQCCGSQVVISLLAVTRQEKQKSPAVYNEIVVAYTSRHQDLKWPMTN
jgi:hypothetical protein